MCDIILTFSTRSIMSCPSGQKATSISPWRIQQTGQSTTTIDRTTFFSTRCPIEKIETNLSFSQQFNLCKKLLSILKSWLAENKLNFSISFRIFLTCNFLLKCNERAKWVVILRKNTYSDSKYPVLPKGSWERIKLRKCDVSWIHRVVSRQVLWLVAITN